MRASNVYTNTVVPFGAAVLGRRLVQNNRGQVTQQHTILHNGVVKTVHEPITTITHGTLIPEYKFRTPTTVRVSTPSAGGYRKTLFSR